MIRKILMFYTISLVYQYIYNYNIYNIQMSLFLIESYQKQYTFE